MINLSKIKLALTTTLFFVFLGLHIQAQNFKKEYKSGETAFATQKYADAAQYYINASKAIKKYKKSHLTLFYKLGYCQMQMKEYQQAANSFAKYQNLAKRVKPKLKELKEVTEWREWCVSEFADYGTGSGKRDPNIKISNLTVLNSTLNDYGAFMTYDKELFIFSSNRLTEYDKDLIDINNDVYISEYKDGTLSKPIRIGSLADKFDELASSVTSDNLTIYFSLSKDYGATSDIYVCEKIAGSWAAPKKLEGDINDKSSWDGYPSISKDGKTLYFVSDRPGSRGKDIYFSIRKGDGSWGTPKNIGYPINTKFDEITPHIDTTGKRLYFSSKGHISYGGFDIYYSDFEASNLWGEPQNMGMPINSDRDDICYVTTEEPGVSLFSSKRKGGKGVYDIYKAEDLSVKNAKPKIEEPIKKEDLIVKKDEPETDVSKKKTEVPKKDEDFGKPVVKEIKKETIAKKTEPAVVKKEQQAVKPVQKTVTPTTTASTSGTNLYSAAVPGLYFKVQIGAYKNHITKYHKVFTSKLNPDDITEEYYPPLYKYTIGQYGTIKNATSYKMKIRGIGYTDAFLTCYYKNNRIPMNEAKKVIKQNAKIN